jgi:hypothetical protein
VVPDLGGALHRSRATGPQRSATQKQ